MTDHEVHRVHRSAWLRAAVLGANDGIVSTASLVLGVAAADPASAWVAGLAGVVGGALSMAVGEYVSVSSQRDVEASDLARESAALQADAEGERAELAAMYVQRGLSPALAAEVATALMAAGALHAHARDELGIDPDALARPWLAAASSALAFAAGALVPWLALVASPFGQVASVVTVTTASLAAVGVVSARLGAAPLGPATARVVVGGWLAMGLTAALGAVAGQAL